MGPEITHHTPVILVAKDRIVEDSQGENRVIAGEVKRSAIDQVLEREPEERSIRQGRWVLEHPPGRILPERETQVGIEHQFSGMQGGEIACVAVGPGRGPLEKPRQARGRPPLFAP